MLLQKSEENVRDNCPCIIKEYEHAYMYAFEFIIDSSNYNYKFQLVLLRK